MKHLLFALSLLSILSFSGCRENNQVSTETGSPKLTKSLQRVKADADLLCDSLNGNWQRMTEGDDRKIASVRRLLDEVATVPNHDVLKQRKLVGGIERVKKLRYSQQSMSDTASITRYDRASDSLVYRSLDLAANTPGIENYPLASELSSDIQQEQNRIILYRLSHDKWARQVNELIRKNGKKLQKLGEPYSSMKPVTVFDLTGK